MEYLIIPIISIGILHIIDMFLTRMYLIKCKKKYANPELLEMNFHRYFFEKFGMNIGPAVSVIFSMFIMIFVGILYYIYVRPMYYIMIGMLVMVGHINFRYAIGFEKREKMLIYNKSYLKEKMKVAK